MKNSLEIKILPIETSDIDEISRLIVLANKAMDSAVGNSKKSFVPTLTEEEKLDEIKSWTETFNERVVRKLEPFSIALKACLEGEPRILGCVFAAVAIGKDKKGKAVIEHHCTHPDFWRKGISLQLLDSAIGQFKDRGVNHFELWAEFNNYGLLKFYQSQGWLRRNGSFDSRSFNGRQSGVVKYEKT